MTKMKLLIFPILIVALMSNVVLGIEVSRPTEIYSSYYSVMPITTNLQISPYGMEILLDIFKSELNNKYLTTIGEIHILNITTGTSNFVAYGHDSSWSPDGKRIVYLGNEANVISYQDPNTGQYRTPDDIIYIMDEGGKKITLKNISQPIESIRWSPDGKKFAYTSKALGYTYIYAMNIDGTNLKRLTDKTIDNPIGPRWSPDESKIAFYTISKGAIDLHILDLNGAKLINPMRRGVPQAWSRDEKKILYTRGFSLYMMNIDGSDEEIINNDTLSADFSLDNEAIYYSASKKASNAEFLTPGFTIDGYLKVYRLNITKW